MARWQDILQGQCRRSRRFSTVPVGNWKASNEEFPKSLALPSDLGTGDDVASLTCPTHATMDAVLLHRGAYGWDRNTRLHYILRSDVRRMSRARPAVRSCCCCTAFPNRDTVGARHCRRSPRRAIAPSRPTSAAIRRARGPIRRTSPTTPSTSWWPTRSRSPRPRATTASASISSVTIGAGRCRGAWPTSIPSGWPRSPSCRGRIPARSAARF